MKRQILAAGALTALLALSGCAGSNAVSTGSDGTYFQFGSGTPLGKLYPVKDRKMPRDFTAALLDGDGTYKLASTKGKIVVINFWASWCDGCQIETPQFSILYNKIKKTGVDFVGIDTKDEANQAKTFVKNNDITFPIVFDQPGKVALALGNIPQVSLPFTVLLDRQGRVAAVYVIRLSDQDLQSAIDKLQAEKT